MNSPAYESTLKAEVWFELGQPERYQQRVPAGEPDSALQLLRVRYPTVTEAEIAAVLAQAERSALHLVGRDDPQLALDLARLRLDVRTHRAFGKDSAPRRESDAKV